MRRIIEFYFKFLAGLKEDELLENFTDRNEQLICRSLIAWINTGSHEIIDDFNISISEEQVENYKTVFRKIFLYSGQIAHYNMMMDGKESIKNA
ncbi:hypothetical protein AT05_10600 [Schleiferia thermophila str. Yellowstone]|jgi:wobble nucleotide-excising tRNase|nr:hypothetical protein AT05_10600 [Schleiferia thermophila str. Yellowstone]